MADIFLKPLAEAIDDFGRVFVTFYIGKIFAKCYFKISPKFKFGVNIAFETQPSFVIRAIIGLCLKPFIEVFVGGLEALFDVKTVAYEKHYVHCICSLVALK